ncbi:F-box-like/WD repeat-containing protein ebi [Pseudolycoriella hygida]|uniref:F-box-like/WD repeat-containing protein ebi n=1 Tax=Pseudolycoriella hygida TaxID=35572 RepID=A0A9Q0RU87_9DIPT|nr:F-box-like/WD repeat-containing protein ebi [Pseudolycoriella hygida]
MDIDQNSELKSPQATMFSGHDSEVSLSNWNTGTDLWGSRFGDSSAQNWNMSNNLTNPNPVILSHISPFAHEGETEEANAVYSLDWNPTGTLLATGSGDGCVRMWTKDGWLVSTFDEHKGPVSDIKWSKHGNYILSAGIDGTTIVWDEASGQRIQQFPFHTEAVFAVDWKANNVFTSCSADKRILVCALGRNRPVLSFQGHTHNVNCIQWDPTGQVLASGSSDKTIKFWSMRKDTCERDLQAHSNEVYTLKWSPTGPGTANPNMDLLLASASFDCTVRLWDAEYGTCTHTLTKHTQPVYSIEFSPDGKYLASGSLDNYVYIWNVQSGQLIHSYKGTGFIVEVCWNSRGSKVGAASNDGNVFVLDLQAGAGNRRVEIPSSNVTVLRGHEKEVITCKWNPTIDLLTSASRDRTARIWHIFDNPTIPNHSGLYQHSQHEQEDRTIEAREALEKLNLV